MDRQFWLERWQRKEIGFHQQEFNAHLQQFWAELAAPVDAKVFVPLCGKSRDMLWLRAQGHSVLGVEISPIAVEEFFAENELTPQVSACAAGERWSCDGIDIICGDFFQLTAHDLQLVAAIYDRASLVALPPAMRGHYVQHLGRILPTQTPILLVSMDYAQAEMDGPPFAVGEEEVRALYGQRYQIEVLHTLDVLAENPKFRERGLTRLHEMVYRLRPG